MSTPSPADRSLLLGIVTLRHRAAKRLAAFIVAVSLVASLMLAVRSAAEHPGRPRRSGLPVETLIVQHLQAYETHREFTGEIVTRRSSDLGFELAGKVIAIDVDEGDEVRAGQALARLDVQRLQTQRMRLEAQRAEAAAILDERIEGPRKEQIAAARAQVAERQADLELVQRKLRKWTQLFDEGAASEEEHDDAVSAREAAAARRDMASHRLEELETGTRRQHIEAQRARVRQLDAQLAAIDVDLSKSVLSAPFAGRIARRLVDEGTVLPAGQQVMQLVEHRALEAHVGVPLPAASSLKIGEPVQLKITGAEVGARVWAHLPVIDPVTRTLTVVLRIDDDSDVVARPGQIVRVPVAERVERPGFWLPNTALVRAEMGLWACYVVGDPDASQDGAHVRRCVVEVLHTEAQRSYVRGLLSDGDRVVACGVRRVVPGQRVEVLASGSEDPATP